MACEKWLAEWKRTAGSFHWFGKAQSWFRNCVPEEKHKLFGKQRYVWGFPVPSDPGLGCHGRDAASTGCSNVALFHLFHIPKVQREDPSVTSQIRQTQADPFLWGPFHGRAQLVWVTCHCRGKGGQVCGTSGMWNSSCIQSWSEWVVRGTAHCLWNQKHLVSGQDVSEMEKSFEIP